MAMCNSVDYRFGLTLSCLVTWLPMWQFYLADAVVRSHLAPPTNLLPHYDQRASVVPPEFLTPVLLCHIQEQQMAVLYFVCVCVCVCVYVCFLILHVD